MGQGGPWGGVGEAQHSTPGAEQAMDAGDGMEQCRLGNPPREPVPRLCADCHRSGSHLQGGNFSHLSRQHSCLILMPLWGRGDSRARGPAPRGCTPISVQDSSL